MTALIAAVGCGALIGYGVRLLLMAAVSTPAPLASLDDLAQPRASIAQLAAAAPHRPSLRHRATASVVSVLAGVGVRESDQRRHQLSILQRSWSQHVMTKLAAAAVAAVVGAVGVAVVSIAAAVSPSVTYMLIAAAVCAAGGFVLPDLSLDDQVAAWQEAARDALSAYLDYVSVMLAGGDEIETALQVAARDLDAPVVDRIRRTLARARTHRTPNPAAFRELAHQLDLDELREIASSLELAGNQGARIRESLTAKSDSLRQRRQAAVKTKAKAASAKMGLPAVAMTLTFTCLVAYGAIVAIDDGNADPLQSTTDSQPQPDQGAPATDT